MNKNSYIIRNSKLYKVTKVHQNLISVTHTNKPMTKKLAQRTYPFYQLEALGYLIEGDVL